MANEIEKRNEAFLIYQDENGVSKRDYCCLKVITLPRELVVNETKNKLETDDILPARSSL